MAYRNGTYVAFHANGTNQPGKSDIDYYNLMKAWTAKSDDDFTMTNSHEKAYAVRDSSRKETLKASLQLRLRNSKNFVLIIGDTTKFDTDWIPFEIAQAVDRYGLPIIAAYAVYGNRILNPAALSGYWPDALASRINNNTAKVMHIPFKKLPLACAIGQFDISNQPPHGLWYYSEEAYNQWNI